MRDCGAAAHLTAYGKGCRCLSCREAQRERCQSYYLANRDKVLGQQIASRKNSDAYLDRVMEYNERNRDYQNALRRMHRQRAQELTQAKAVHAGSPWTPVEDDCVLRTDLSTTEAALALGRTSNAVENRRKFLRRFVLA